MVDSLVWNFCPLVLFSSWIIKIFRVARIYVRGGFVVCLVLIDMKFEKVSDKCNLIEINTIAAMEHVGEIEHEIRLINEHSWCGVANL